MINIGILSKKLQTGINKIISEYQYVNIPEGLFQSILDEVWNDSVIEYSRDSKETFNNGFLEKLRDNLNFYIRLKFIEKDYGEILKEYISCNIKEHKGIKEIKKINELFRKIGYEPDTESYYDIIQFSSTLSSLISNFVTKNFYDIKEGRLLEEIDEDLSVFIESYCIQEGIELKEDIEESMEELIEKLEQEEDNNEYIDAVKQYLKEIRNKCKNILTHEEEVELGYRIKQGDLKAKEQLIERNLRLPVSIAKRHKDKGVFLLDLIQDGNLGLVKAVEKYDPTKGYKFSTYATYWVEGEIKKAIIEMGRSVKIPDYMVRKINKLFLAEKELMFELGRKPSFSELAKKLNKDVSYIEYLYKINQDIDSLNRKISTKGSHGESEMVDLIGDTNSKSTEEQVNQSQLRENLEKLMESNLNSRYVEILKLRCGFYGKRERTLEEVGEIFNITEERVRQLEEKALRNLRKLKIVENFTIYMDRPKQCLENISLLKKMPTSTIKSSRLYINKLEKSKKQVGVISTRKQDKKLEQNQERPDGKVRVIDYNMPLDIRWGVYKIDSGYHNNLSSVKSQMVKRKKGSSKAN